MSGLSVFLVTSLGTTPSMLTCIANRPASLSSRMRASVNRNALEFITGVMPRART
jgi:hypothetical protein